MNRGLKEKIRRLLPRRIAAHAVRSGRIAGARIVTSWHDYPGAILGTTEKPLLEWFTAHVKAGETWLDVGAHYGYTAIALARLVGPSGRVFAFEPVLTTAGCINRTRELNEFEQLTVVPIGLNDSPNPIALNLPTIRGMADSTIGTRAWSERILAASLDSLWPSLSGGEREVHGIKIDVQGMEFEVLRGMRDVLREFSPKLVVEFHRGVDRGEILRMLAECGYETHCNPIDATGPHGEFGDDLSYAFQVDTASCESLSIASSTARN